MSTTNRPLYLPYAGSALLETPLLNKGSGFSAIERQSFNLTGLIPPMVESIQEQSERAYKQFSGFGSPAILAAIFAGLPGNSFSK
jgi:malate dehydrogenase (oxaloacetate-decarboxylating)